MFISQEINNAILSVKNKTENFLTRLNSVSEDIKQLETFLQDEAIGIPIKYVFFTDILNQTELEFIRNIDWVQIPCEIQESIFWKRDEKSKKFRLLYQRELVALDCPLEIPPNFYGIMELKPLIECTVDIRLRGYEAIPLFLKKLEKEMVV